MELNIRAGMRVLYKKNNSNWLVGQVNPGNGIINENGIFIPILTQKGIEQKGATKDTYTWDEEPEYVMINVNDIYADAHPLEDWMKDTLITKEEYINIIHGEDFHRTIESAWVSDGEYYYYPVSKFNDNWIAKQPFDYILRAG